VGFRDVVFLYETAGAPVFDGLTCQFPPGWTGVIGPNGCGKTTLLRLACGELAAGSGVIDRPDRAVYCPQRTDDPPPQLPKFIESTEQSACALRGRLGIGDDWPARWETLSHGERKRAQIAVALWEGPQVLAIDEPTNHIDLAARRLLGEALAAFRGVGLLVSHDRHLLDTLCGRCLFIEPPRAEMRPGGYTKATEQLRAEWARARRAHAEAKRELWRLRREAEKRRREAARAHRKRSKRNLGPRDHDARERIDRARLTGKDGQAGRLLRQLDGRLRHAREKLACIRVHKHRRLGIDMQAARAKRDFLFRLPAGAIALGPARRLVHPPLTMRPPDRVALIGPNGGGKSTLVRYILSRLNLPADKVVYLAQELDRSQASQTLSAARGLPRQRLGEVMSIVACLGSAPQRLMESEQPSPGELRKLMLAVGMANRPWLIVMDEPTNHLDLPSIECLEDALSDCPCALLLVSHDERFVEKLTTKRWELSAEDDPAPATMRLRIRRGCRHPG
jgi:ATPase subunit of ABC transporter with duplicated ATPase domains